MVMATDQTIRPAAESLAMIKANANKMVMSTNDNDKKMAVIFLDMHATLEKMIADQKEKKVQQEAAAFPATTVTLSELAAPLPHLAMVSPKPVAALPKYVVATTTLPGLLSCLPHQPVSLPQPRVEAMIFKDSCRHRNLSSTWGLLGLQPWPPPQLEDELSRKEGSSVMGRVLSHA